MEEEDLPINIEVPTVRKLFFKGLKFLGVKKLFQKFKKSDQNDPLFKEMTSKLVDDDLDPISLKKVLEEYYDD